MNQDAYILYKGLEFDYVGVLIGEDLGFDNKVI